MPRSPTGRYCDSPPRSPRHYDKYTYASKRRPEGLEEAPLSPNGAVSHAQRHSARGHAYDAVVAGVAPLMTNVDGFAIAEDGSIQSRFVSAPRFSAPSIAMVPMPYAHIPAQAIRQGSVDGLHTPQRVHGALLSPAKIAPVQYNVVSEVVPSQDAEAWRRLVMIAGRDFKEDELAQLNWETLSELLTHYKVHNVVEIARIQLAWKRRQGLLPSDSVESHPVEFGTATYVTSPVLVRYPTYGSPSTHPSTLHSPARASFSGATSPRRSSPSRFVPVHRQRASYEHVSPKIDTGRRTPTRGSPRAPTPTRLSNNKRQ
jgi:hypothetical protein